jgi:hypothetical protein
MSRKKSSRARPRSLSPRQAAFVRYYTDRRSDAWGNATRACQRAGYRGKPGSNQLAVQGARLLRNRNIQAAFRLALVKQGFTLEFRAKILMDAMNAKKVQLLPTARGKLVPVVFPDHQRQMQGLETALRWWGTAPTRDIVARVPPCDYQRPPKNPAAAEEYSSAERLLLRSGSEKVRSVLQLVGQNNFSTAELRELLLRLTQQDQTTLNDDSTNNS